MKRLTRFIYDFYNKVILSVFNSVNSVVNNESIKSTTEKSEKYASKQRQRIRKY